MPLLQLMNMISRWLNNEMYVLKQHVKSVLTSLSLSIPPPLKWRTGLESSFCQSSCVYSLFTFSQEGALKPVSMETTRSQSVVLLCASCDPEPVVERCIEVGSQAVCWLRFIKRKYKPLRWKSSLEHNVEGEWEGYGFYRLKRKNIFVLSCWGCISQLREGEWVVNDGVDVCFAETIAYSSHFSLEITLNRIFLMRFDKINNIGILLKNLLVQQSARKSNSEPRDLCL